MSGSGTIKAETAESVVRRRKFSAYLSLYIGMLMLVMKMGAYLVTGSAAILSDALESVVHVAATGFALFSVILSARPPDPSHPYGHGKVEFFSAGMEGALIVVAAVAIIYEAAPQLLPGPDLRALGVGIPVVAAAGLVNLALGIHLVRTGRKTNSLVLVADGRHVLTDSYTSLAVLVGLILVLLTGFTRLDPIVAIAVAVNILFTGGRLIYRSVRGLMDTAEPAWLEEVVRILRSGRRPGWIDLHRLRIIRAGDEQHIDLHLTVPRFWDIAHGHAEQEELERIIDREFPVRTQVIVHLDPCVDVCCTFCRFEPCPVRAAPCAAERTWEVAHAVSPADYQDGD